MRDIGCLLQYNDDLSANCGSWIEIFHIFKTRNLLKAIVPIPCKSNSGGRKVSKSEENRKNAVINNDDKTERKSIRWLMVVYDSILYSLCWLTFFGFHPSVEEQIPAAISCLYFISGYVLFFGFRFERF